MCLKNTLKKQCKHTKILLINIQNWTLLLKLKNMVCTNSECPTRQTIEEGGESKGQSKKK